MSRKNLRWKSAPSKEGEPEEHRLRRGDLTLATVMLIGGKRWYFHGRVPGGEHYASELRSGGGGEWANVEDAKRAAASWVVAEERRLAVGGQ